MTRLSSDEFDDLWPIDPGYPSGEHQVRGRVVATSAPAPGAVSVFANDVKHVYHVRPIITLVLIDEYRRSAPGRDALFYGQTVHCISHVVFGSANIVDAKNEYWCGMASSDSPDVVLDLLAETSNASWTRVNDIYEAIE